MIGGTPDTGAKDAIAASWERCKRQHKLVRDSARPIMRLQTSEIAPRLEQIVERTGGRQGFFRQIARVVGDGTRCLVITDADGVLVRLEAVDAGGMTQDWNGIALGSCWDERIAGTNGVAMALRTKRAFTVRGAQHFYSRLTSFACTGAPILDAEGTLVGSVNLVTFDHGKRTDHLFAQQFLETAAHRIQRRLFEQRFADEMMVTVSSAALGHMLSEDGLIAVDEAGIILGATQAVERLWGEGAPGGLKGQPFEAVFAMESQSLANVPGRVLSMPMAKGPVVNLSARTPREVRPARPAPSAPAKQMRQRRLPPSLRQLATGSKTMAAVCAQAETMFHAGMPLLIEGETGTGKSALVAALAGAAPILKVDCASIFGSEDDTRNLRAVLARARVVATIPGTAQTRATVVFDNIAELPANVQAELRRQMDDLEADLDCGAAEPGHPRIVSLSRQPLAQAVAERRFRDDLYYMLGASRLCLPPLRDREQPEVLAQVLATQIAGRTVDLSDVAADLIRAHPFPGNVRELRSALERALMTAAGGRITPVDLLATSIATGGTACSTPVATTPRLAYDERTLVLDALTSSGWNVSEAARRLGMGRATINRKIKRHGLVRPG